MTHRAGGSPVVWDCGGSGSTPYRPPEQRLEEARHLVEDIEAELATAREQERDCYLDQMYAPPGEGGREAYESWRTAVGEVEDLQTALTKAQDSLRREERD